MDAMNQITPYQLQALIETKAIKQVEVIGTPQGFLVKVNKSFVLLTHRGTLRFFKSSATLIRYMKQAGINQFIMNIEGIENE